jgi:hypothetical protein
MSILCKELKTVVFPDDKFSAFSGVISGVQKAAKTGCIAPPGPVKVSNV